MKRKLVRALCAATLAGLGANASAVPIQFNFTGTVNQANGTFAQTGLEGTAVSGGFVFETLNLTRMLSPHVGMVQYFDLSAPGSYAFLNVGSSSIAFPVYPGSNINNVVFYDSVCDDTVVHCSASEYEHFDLVARSLDAELDIVTAPGFIGTYRDSNFGISATDWSVSDYIDWNTAGPADIVTLPVGFISGYFSASTYLCSGESFCTTAEYGDFGFSIDSVTRSLGSSTSVPEPGALGLLGAAGLGLIAFGRRRKASNL
jgi:hypothetical protein